MLAAGYTKSMAERGKASMCDREGCDHKAGCDLAKFNTALAKQYGETLGQAEELSEQIDSETFRKIVRGSLVRNLAERSDLGLGTIKAAGSLAELNMFQPESSSNVIIINAAPIPSFDSVPKWSERLQRYVSAEDSDYALRDRWCPKLGRTITADGEFFRLPDDDEQALIRKHSGCDCGANPKFKPPAKVEN